jgi:hypothetical protein
VYFDVIASASEAIHKETRKQGWIASLALAMTVWLFEI